VRLYKDLSTEEKVDGEYRIGTDSKDHPIYSEGPTIRIINRP